MSLAPLKLQVTSSQLVLLDMQVKLASAMPVDAMADVVKNCGILLQAAKILDVSLIVTEQYPQGLGHTLPELTALLPACNPVEKIAFSCVNEPKFNRQLTRDHAQVVLSGMEAHICILQTALDLLAAGKQVFIAEDAVISRSYANKANAIARMRDAGCVISNTESIVFEWLGMAGSDAFKAISKLVR